MDQITNEKSNKYIWLGLGLKGSYMKLLKESHMAIKINKYYNAEYVNVI